MTEAADEIQLVQNEAEQTTQQHHEAEEVPRDQLQQAAEEALQN